MKRILAVGLIFSYVFLLAGCQREERAKKEIFSLVEENYDAIVAACEDKNTEALLAVGGITKVDIVDRYVMAFCKGTGIAPSSQDYGFYYSEENLPVAVFDGQILCATAELFKEGSGYQYVDSGYNVFYTEHIKGNLYFYSASF